MHNGTTITQFIIEEQRHIAGATGDATTRLYSSGGGNTAALRVIADTTNGRAVVDNELRVTNGLYVGGIATAPTDDDIMLDGYIHFKAEVAAAAPAANEAKLYIKDNGSGKTQLCVKFADGSAQVLATEV